MCDVLQSTSEMGSLDVLMRRFVIGVAHLPESDLKDFLTGTVTADIYNALYRTRTDYYRIIKEEEAFLDLMYFYAFHPDMSELKCDLSPLEDGLANHIWDNIEVASNEFSQDYQSDYSKKFLIKTKFHIDLFSKYFNLRKEINRICFSGTTNLKAAFFCKLVPIVELYDKIESYTNDDNKYNFNIVAANLLVYPVWDSFANEKLPPYTLQNISQDRQSEIYRDVTQYVTNAVQRRDNDELEKLQHSLPSFSLIQGCTGSVTEFNMGKCTLYAIQSQLVNYNFRATPKRVNGAVLVTVHDERDLEKFLRDSANFQTLSIVGRSENTLHDVAGELSKQIHCTATQTTSAVLTNIGLYFDEVESFDAQKSSLDVAYIIATLDTYTMESSKIAETVDKNVGELITAAIVCAAADLVSAASTLAIALARLCNPFGWLTGSVDPNDVVEAMEYVMEATNRVARAAKLSSIVSSVQEMVSSMVEKFEKNQQFLESVKYLIDNLHITDAPDDDRFQESQALFLSKYGEYEPALTLPDITKVVGYLKHLVTESCDIIEEVRGPSLVVGPYKTYISGDGLCYRTEISVDVLADTYSEIYQYQFDLMEAMASVMRAKTGVHAARNMDSGWENAARCDTRPFADTLNRFAMLAGASYVVYEIQQWHAVKDYCDRLQYLRGGKRPTDCNGMDTDITKLLSLSAHHCEWLRVYKSIPTKIEKASYKDVTTGSDSAKISISALFAGLIFKFPTATG